MAVAETVARGLSATDLQQIRDWLAAGRKPRVQFTESAGQVAGQVGQVVALADPELSDEWVVVRFGKDELPFAPIDLMVTSRAPIRRSPTIAVPSPREESPVPAPPTLSTVDEARRSGTGDGSARKDGGSSNAGPGSNGAAASGAGVERKPVPRKAAKGRPPAALVVTVSYLDGEWTVRATQGTRTLAKPAVIKPADALRMVALLDSPGVREAVEEIVTAARAQAEQQAERLRAELAAIEARLAELRAA